MIIELNKNGKKELFKNEKITGFIFRTALRLKERQEEEKLTTYLLDDIAQFVCDVFGNRFTVSELYHGLEKSEILETFNNVIKKIILSTTSAYQKH